MKAMKQLSELEYKNRYADKPNFPEYAKHKRKYSDKTANGLTRCIVDFLNLSGHFAERISTTGRPLDKRKTVTDVIGRTRQIGQLTWIPGTSTRGSADISATVNGLSIKIEVKKRDSQSDHQKIYQQKIERAGGLYWICRNFDDFIEKYNNLLKK